MKKQITIIKGMEKTAINIRFDDQCGNGHADFAITCDVWEKTGSGHWRETMGGCCHEHILKLRPDLKIFVDLHLSDQNGAPMYATANGFYHLFDKAKTQSERGRIAEEYLRCTPAELEVLRAVENKDYFQYSLENLGLPERWKKEAALAIAKLEELTGTPYTPEPWERSNYTPLDKEERATIEAQAAAGFYEPEQVEKRALESRTAAKNKRLLAISGTYADKVYKAEAESRLRGFLVQRCFEIGEKEPDFVDLSKHAIHYTHTNELCFNWLNSSDVDTFSFNLFTDSLSEDDFQDKDPQIESPEYCLPFNCLIKLLKPGTKAALLTWGGWN